MQRVLITGISSGLGLGFARALLDDGCQVYGISRRGAPLRHPKLAEIKADLRDANIGARLEQLLRGTQHLDLAILNAGVLGDIKPMVDTSIEELEAIMASNVWSAKVVLDHFIRHRIAVAKVILISSGAAVNGHYGWGGYALSKAALNMLAQLYAHEMPETQVLALAPGLVDTAMQDHLCGEVDAQRYPSTQKLRDARGTAAMPGPDQAARHILEILPDLNGQTSGDFVDVRHLD